MVPVCIVVISWEVRTAKTKKRNAVHCVTGYMGSEDIVNKSPETTNVLLTTESSKTHCIIS